MDGDQNGAVGTRIGRLMQKLAELLRTRWEQAQREGRAVVRDLVTGVVLIVVAVVLVALAVPLAVVTVILVLAEVVPAWSAVGLVFAVMLLLAGALLLVARSKLRRKRFKIVQDLREDAAVIQKTLRREA